jgi:hypothetical protein
MSYFDDENMRHGVAQGRKVKALLCSFLLLRIISYTAIYNKKAIFAIPAFWHFWHSLQNDVQ